MRPSRLPRALVCVAAVLAVASGCGDTSATPADPTGSAAPASASGALVAEDSWVKAADSGMTAAFGTLVNSSDEEITIVGAASGITSAMELHETVDSDGTMMMQAKEGGFVVPAGGSYELSPGGDHLMIMDLLEAIEPGEEVTLVLELADGTTQEIVSSVKDFDGADEEYKPADMDMSGMS